MGKEFPNAFVSIQEKKSYGFGTKVAKAIFSDWYYSGRSAEIKAWITKMRDYSNGTQKTNYKKFIEGSSNDNDNDLGLKFYKINYSDKLKIMRLFKDVTTNRIDESLFQPRAEAIDIISVNKKKDYFKTLDESFFLRDFNKIINDGLGVNLSPKTIPKDEAELNALKTEYKPRIEIAEEQAINTVMKKERFEVVKNKIDEDLHDLGFGIGQHYTDSREGIKIAYTDPYNFIFDRFEMDDARDMRWCGVEKKGTIGQIIKMAGGKMTSDHLALINKKYPDGNGIIDYFSFAYLMEVGNVYKRRTKNGITKLINRTKDEVPYKNKNRLEVPDIVWYEGVYIPELELLVKWDSIENQVEEGVNEPVCPFIISAPKIARLSENKVIPFYSQVERAIPILDSIQIDWYKLMQLKAELRPNIVHISPKALNNVIIGNSKVSAKTILKLFLGRGLYIGDDVDEHGDPIGRAIREEGGGINNSALGFLSSEFANNLNKLRQLLGINELIDGTANVNSRTSVAGQKMLLASANTAISHLVKGSFDISLRFCRAISYRLTDVLNSKTLRGRYENMIGSDNIDLLDAIKDIPVSMFAIYFDFKPDDKERFSFEQSLVNSYNSGEINVAQYNKARQVRNYKNAIKYLEYVIGVNRERLQKEKLQNIEAQAQANAKSSIESEREKQATISVTFEKESTLLRIKHDLELDRMNKESLVKELSAEKEHERKKELAFIERDKTLEKVNTIEDRKDKRIDQKDNNQAVLIEKRKDISKEVKFGYDFSNEINNIFNKN